MTRTPSFLSALSARPDVPLALVNARTGVALATNVEPAFDSESRRRGLLGRDHLAEGSALILAPCWSVHTFFMRFAIDIAFVARNGDTLKVRHRCGPWRLAAALNAFATVELPAGAIAQRGLQVGDRLELRAS